jgi:Abnormal spindle-like microcephaly-assoc'd, ASPM-SPD-2-Hydin/IPT/TIG domain
MGGTMQPKSTAAICGPRRFRISIGKRGRVPLATIGVVVLLSAIFAPPAAAVPTPIEVSSSALDFGNVAVGATSQMPVQVTNTSTSPFGPINIFGGAPPTAEFNASQNCQATTLAGGASCQITYSFSPGSPGSFSDSSNFTISQTSSQADGEDFSVALTGHSGPPPTITNFAPTMGDVGASVVITGTGFLGTSAVEFNGVAATFTENSDTQITATVPAGATTGPIMVTAIGTATSATNFTVVVRHKRTITLKLRKHLVAKGRVSAADDFAKCESRATVKVQRRRRGTWRTIGTDVTGPAGRYRESLPDRKGRYRAKVKKRVRNDGADVCRGDVSPVRRHTHA